MRPRRILHALTALLFNFRVDRVKDENINVIWPAKVDRRRPDLGCVILSSFYLCAGSRSPATALSSMSPTLLQQNENANTASLAFTNPVTAGSFLLAVCRDAQNLSVSDNLNGAWTPLLTGELQSTLPYTIAYLPISEGGVITVSTSPSNTSLTIAEISSAVLRAYSVVNSGTISGTSAVEFTSANVAALANDLLLGYPCGWWIVPSPPTTA